MPRSVSWTTCGPLSAPTTSTFVPGPMTQNFPAPSSTTASTSGEPRLLDRFDHGARAFARDLRLQLSREHLDRTPTDDKDLLDPVRAFAAFADTAQNSNDGTTPGPAAPAHPDGCARIARRASRSSPGFGPPRSTGPSMTRTHEHDIFADPTDSDDGKCKGSTTEAHLPSQEIPAYPPNDSLLTVQPPRGPKAPSAARVRGGKVRRPIRTTEWRPRTPPRPSPDTRTTCDKPRSRRVVGEPAKQDGGGGISAQFL